MKVSRKILLSIGAVSGVVICALAFTNAAASPARARASVMSAEKDRATVLRFQTGRAEFHTGDRANNCFSIFRHNSVTGEFIIPAARFQWNRKDDGYQVVENSLTTSGFLKTYPNYLSPDVPDDLNSALEVALLMHAGSEAALVVFNEANTLAHIMNLYMDNSRVLHLRDFGYEADRNDQLHNSYRWARAILYVNNFPGSNRPAGNPNVAGPNPPDDHLAESEGTYSAKLKELMAYPMPEPEGDTAAVIAGEDSEEQQTTSDESED